MVSTTSSKVSSIAFSLIEVLVESPMLFSHSPFWS
jgi:hypothetical protein